MKNKTLRLFILVACITLIAIFFVYKKTDYPSIKSPTVLTDQSTTPNKITAITKSQVKTTTKDTSSNSSHDYQKKKFQPITVDALIDIADKTKLNEQFIDNHNNLLKLLHEINQRNKDVTLQIVKQWLQILINDLYLINKFYLKHEINIDIRQINSFDPSLIPEKNETSSRIETTYIQALKKLINAANEVKGHELNEREADYFTRRIKPLLKRSKEESQVFYLTLMKKYLRGVDYSLQEKIDFARSFISVGDKRLMKYSLQYFKGLSEDPNQDTDQIVIEQFIDELIEGISL